MITKSDNYKDINNLTHDFFLGFIKIHILYHAVERKVYGLWLIEELSRHGYKISPGTLYPMLHSLEKEKYLKCQKELVKGRIRKYYKTTEKGKRVLIEARKKIKELIKEVIIWIRKKTEDLPLKRHKKDF